MKNPNRKSSKSKTMKKGKIQKEQRKMEVKEKNIKNAFINICTELNNEIENNYLKKPYGCCYLFGHCLTEGLKKNGIKAVEKTGTIIMKNKVGNNDIIYGKLSYPGYNVGYYHTWCEAEIDGKVYILDPSLQFNKLALKEYYNLTCNDLIPNILVSQKRAFNTLKYIEDKSLTHISKQNLKNTNPLIISQLIDKVKIDADNMIAF